MTPAFKGCRSPRENGRAKTAVGVVYRSERRRLNHWQGMQEMYAICASVPRRPRTRNLEIIKRLDDLRCPYLTLLAGTKWYI